MATVFSHVIQSRFSRQNEDVATEALAFILAESESARNQFTRALRELLPGIPSPVFRTQQQEDETRPDITGTINGTTRVFIENKFWAGLTDNQPVGYLDALSKVAEDAALVFVVPEARVTAVWRELLRRLENAGTGSTSIDSGFFHETVETTPGVRLAITTWPRLLNYLSVAVSDQPGTLSDISQLLSLCQAADIDAFLPITAEEITDQRTAALVLQLSDVIEEATQKGISEGIISIDGLRPQSSRERLGRYARFPGAPFFWFGIHFQLWKQHGSSPLWMQFYSEPDFMAVDDVAGASESYLRSLKTDGVWLNKSYAIPVLVETSVEKDAVIESILDSWRTLQGELQKRSRP